MPLISSVEHTFGKPGIPATRAAAKFPIDTLIPFNGADPALPGWARYSAADGYYLSATRTANLVGTTSARTNYSGSASSVVTGYAGTHSGSTTVQQWVKQTAGTVNYWNQARGDHAHGASGSSSMPSQENMLSIQEITFLRATEEQLELPANSLVFSSTQPTNSTAYGSTDYRYLKGSASTLNYTAGVAQTVGLSSSTGSGGDHTHENISQRGTAYPYITGGYLRLYEMGIGYPGGPGGSHSHSALFNGAQSSINSVLLKLWQMNASLIPKTDTIAMYVGALSSLPVLWKICDGLNNTVNIPQTVIGYTTSGWNVLTSANASYGLTGIGTSYASHNHAYSLRSTALNVSGPVVYHNNFAWTHTHTGGGGGYATAYRPPTINVAFIQYKG